MSLSRFKLVFFCPRESTRNILDHLFRIFPNELGNIGNYQRCAFITQGTGQFFPNAGASPTIGIPGKLELVDEHKVELVISDKGQEVVKNAIKELKNVHPYEEVAYDVYKLEDF